MTKQNKGRKLFAVSASAALVASAIVPVASASADFADADKIASWAVDAVNYASEQGIIGGKPGNVFDPTGDVLRGEAAKMLALAGDLEIEEEATADFSDVEADAWYTPFIAAAVEAGIIQGKGEGKFAPNDKLTRAEAAVLFTKLYPELEAGDEDLSSFPDSKGLAAWKANALKVAVNNGIINGKGDKLAADDNISRQEFAVIVYRALEATGNLVGDVDPIEEAVEAVTEAVKAAAEFKEVTADNAEEAQAALDTLTEALDTLNALIEENEVELTEEQAAALAAAEAVAAQLEAAIEDLTGTEVAIVSATAVNKTKVEVKFNTEIDAAAAENFTIEGASVTAATLSEDKKSVALDVTGLDYGKEYTVAVAGILVAGEATEIASAKFTTPTVDALWNLVVEPAEASITADGADNTTVTFKLVNKETNTVDENADNVVLKVSTTYGSLANDRVTIQDGQAQVTLTSEFSVKNLTSKIDAQIIEAGKDYQELIGKVVGTATVQMKIAASDVATKSVISSESNQADRVTVFFDSAVALSDFVETDTYGNLLYNVTTVDAGTVTYYAEDGTSSTTYSAADHNLTADASKKAQKSVAFQTAVTTGGEIAQINHVVKTNGAKTALAVTQETTGNPALSTSSGNFGAADKLIQGFRPVSGNSNAIEVILADPNLIGGNELEDNTRVYVQGNIKNSAGKVTTSESNFVLTDARNPEVTKVSAQGMNQVVAQFSESVVASGDTSYRFDGLATSINEFDNGTPNESDIVIGKFNALTLEDNRNIATITLNNGYDADPTDANNPLGYFAAGNHSIQVVGLRDHANTSDQTSNIGTTQTLQFNVKADTTRPTATVKTDSPEQFRVTFDKELAEAAATVGTSLVVEIYDADADEWYPVDNSGSGTHPAIINAQTFDISKVSGSSTYVLEAKTDWTEVFETSANNVNYNNFKFRISVAKDALTNKANGLKNNKALTLDLSASGSALLTKDVTSPKISDIIETTDKGIYEVVMSEPVKLPGVDDEDTPSETQTSVSAGNLPSPVVTFIGKDKDGKEVEFQGIVRTSTGYTSADLSDKAFEVEWVPNAAGKTPQDIVDAGGSETWTLAVASISDDIGNTAETLTKTFKLAKTPTSTVAFEINDTGIAGNAITITYSTAIVRDGGANDATSLSQYTLNGGTLPVGTDIQAVDLIDAATGTAGQDGVYESVIITLPGTVTLPAINTITVNKNLLNTKGTKLTGQFEWVLQ